MKLFIGLALILIAVASTANGLVIKKPALGELDGKEMIQNNKLGPYKEGEKMNIGQQVIKKPLLDLNGKVLLKQLRCWSSSECDDGCTCVIILGAGYCQC